MFKMLYRWSVPAYLFMIFFMQMKDTNYAPAGYLDTEAGRGNLVLGAWRREVESSTNNLSGHPTDRPSTLKAQDIRNDMKDYLFLIRCCQLSMENDQISKYNHDWQTCLTFSCLTILFNNFFYNTKVYDGPNAKLSWL